MPAVALIQDQLRRSFEGRAWHGPAVMEILKGVTARQAAARPIGNAHSIWELVLHMTAWHRAVLARLQGGLGRVSAARNFPAVTDTGEAAWRRAIEELRHSHAEIMASVNALPKSRLSETVRGKKYTLEFMLHGLIQHDLYHAGQMALLKKALTA